MKKVCVNYLFIIFSFLGLGLLSSCGGEEDVPKPLPTITFIPSETEVTLDAGKTHNVSVSYKAEQKIEKITVYKKVGATENTYEATKTKDFKSATEDIIVYALPAEASGEAVYRFNLVDKDGKEVNQTLTVKTKAGSTGAAINSYDVVLLGSQTNTSTGSFYASSSNTVYTIANAKSNSGSVDFGYAVGTTKGAMLGAPADDAMMAIFNGATSGIQTWATKNQTTFKATALTATEFDAIADDATIVANAPSSTFTTGDAGNSRAKATEIAAGKVVAFRTAAGKLGLAKVTARTDSEINLSIKVQK